ncbi:hypothetical protein TNCV_946261 [Trichonephila clavipes]|nr:hypothetical protein TNCV_946261 [Trichonephila clavipes]
MILRGELRVAIALPRVSLACSIQMRSDDLTQWSPIPAPWIEYYGDEVLEPYVGLFTGAVDPDIILMDDNARHIQLISSMNFWKMRIFAESIRQLDLQISSISSMPSTL